MSLVYTFSLRPHILQRWQTALADHTPVALPNCDATHENATVLLHWQSLTDAERGSILAGSFKSTVIVLSDLPDTEEASKLILAGVKGYANTYIHDSLLPEVLLQVRAGNVWAVPEVMQRLLQGFLKQPRPQQASVSLGDLTDREREVYSAIKTGLTNKRIASRLGVSERTIKAHVSAILNKTGVKDRVDLILAQGEIGNETL